MKLANDRPTTQSARIYRLEQARETDGKRLDSMEKKVDEMHDILVGLRQVGRAARAIIYWFGGPTVVIGLAVGAWKMLLH